MSRKKKRQKQKSTDADGEVHIARKAKSKERVQCDCGHEKDAHTTVDARVAPQGLGCIHCNCKKTKEEL